MDELIQQLKEALKSLTTLEIRTVVGGVIKNGNDIDPDWAKNPPVALTRIDLVQGDITTVYDPAFVTGEYQALREFHADREKQGHEIIEANIRAIKALAELAMSEWANK